MGKNKNEVFHKNNMIAKETSLVNGSGQRPRYSFSFYTPKAWIDIIKNVINSIKSSSFNFATSYSKYN